MKGILFKPWKIKAIADNPDREYQTRRVIKPQFRDWQGHYWYGKANGYHLQFNDYTLEEIKKHSRYQVGEVVYIKEAWCAVKDGAPGECVSTTKQDWDIIQYQDKWLLKSPSKKCIVGRQTFSWRSPLFMPAWAARIFIRITDVLPQRLQEISAAEALKEGISGKGMSRDWVRDEGHIEGRNFSGLPTNGYAERWYIAQSAKLWNSINPKYPWESNPWVFRYTFEVVKDAGQ